MSKTWASSSSLERVTECAASTVLPQTQSVNKWSSHGLEVHGALEAAVNNGDILSVSIDGDNVSREALEVPVGSMAEWGFSYDVVSGEAKSLGYVGQRNYPEAPFSTVFGTADLFWMSTIQFLDSDTEHKCVMLRDWKTNFEPPPPDSWQMRFLAFAAAKATGAAYARTQISHLKNGVCRHSDFKLWGPEDFKETEAMLRKAYDTVNKLGWKKDRIGLQDVRHGPHCHWCPALASCPYFQTVIRGEAANGAQAALLTNHDAVIAYARWQALKTAAGKLEEAVKAYASRQPIILDKGYKFGKNGAYYKRYRAMGDEE